MTYLSGHRILAHEFTHLLQDETVGISDTKLAEGLADMGISIAYEPNDPLLLGHARRFMQGHNIDLLVWGQTVADYGQAYTFDEFISENYGGNTSMNTIMQNPGSYKSAVTQALQSSGKSFDEVFREFSVAIFLDDTSIQGGIYGYPAMNLPIYMPLDKDHSSYPASGSISSVKRYSAQYVAFNNANGDLNISVSVTSGTFLGQVVLRGKAGTPNDVKTITISGGKGATTVSGLGSSYVNATLVMAATSAGSFSYEAKLGGTPGTGSISGKVKDQSGTGIAGATVELHNASSGSLVSTATSAGTGDYNFPTVQPGTYNLIGKKAGYNDGTLNGVTVAAGQAATGKDITLTQTTPTKGTIKGTVKDTSSAPLGGVNIKVYNAGDRTNPVTTATSMANGSYSATGLNAGSYDVVANKTGYFDTEKNGNAVFAGKTTIVDLTMSLWSGIKGKISGLVKDSKTLNGISGVDAKVYNAGTTTLVTGTTTDSSGSYSVDLFAGSYDIVFNTTGYIEGKLTSLPIQSGKTTNGDISLDPQQSGTLGSIHGIIKDKQGGFIASATVSISGPLSRNINSDSSGNYKFKDLPAGTYTVNASCTGYKSQSRSVTVSTSAETVNFILEPSVPNNNNNNPENPLLASIGGVPVIALIIIAVVAVVLVLFVLKILSGGPVCYNCGAKNKKGDVTCRQCFIPLNQPTYAPSPLQSPPAPPPPSPPPPPGM
jgi:protocatechuate 3,4-dioxygenase beta subunit